MGARGRTWRKSVYGGAMDGHVASLDGGATGGAAGRAGGFAGAVFRGERGRTDRGSVDVSLCGSPPRPLLNKGIYK